jgi:hypothetical protein
MKKKSIELLFKHNMALVRRIKAPCPKCPYNLGLVHTVVNPCPQCMASSYQTFERFQKQAIGDGSTSEHEKR